MPHIKKLLIPMLGLAFMIQACEEKDTTQPEEENEVEEYKTPASIPDFSQRTKTVSVDAQSGGDGSDETPWTLKEAMEQAQPGDTVGIKAGIYIGTNEVTETSSRYSPAFAPANSGTEEAPIVFVAEHQASLVSTGYTEIRSGATETGNGWPAFGVLTKDYIYWVGIYSDENVSNNKGCPDSGPCTIWTTTGSRVQGCVIVGEDVNYVNNHSAIRLENGSELTVSDNQLKGFNQNAENRVNQSGIISYAVTNTYFEYNDISNCGTAIQMKGGEHYGNHIRYNTFHDNLGSTLRLHGLIKGTNGEGTNFYQNIFYNNEQEIEITSSGSLPDEALEAMSFFNNSIYKENGTAGSSFLWITDHVEKHTNKVFNNAVFVNGKRAYYLQESAGNSAGNFVGYVQPDYNCYFGASRFGDGSSSSNLNDISLSQWQELTQQDLHSILADPAFVDLSATGLKLGSGSPCFDAGKDQGMLLGNDAEAAINIGAYISDDQSEIFGVRNAQN